MDGQSNQVNMRIR